VALEGRRFERFLGQDVASGATVRLAFPGSRDSLARFRSALPLVLAALALALGMGWGRRVVRAAAPAAHPAVADDPDTLARAIAALDNATERLGPSGGAPRAVYDRRRAELKERLVAALAAVARDDARE
jgi:hypothetical protein